jgi:hypothetical protein
MPGEQAEADEQVGLTASHGLLEVENGLRRRSGQTCDTLADQVLHSLGDVRLLEEDGAFSLCRDQLIKLLDLVAELDGQRIRLKLAGVADGFHSLVTRIIFMFGLPALRCNSFFGTIAQNWWNSLFPTILWVHIRHPVVGLLQGFPGVRQGDTGFSARQAGA